VVAEKYLFIYRYGAGNMYFRRGRSTGKYIFWVLVQHREIYSFGVDAVKESI
jgi:hypothetical protein